MGNHSLRHDTECQNCGHNVLENYCPHCGQKNTETRQSFGHLLAHFVEDLTHYDTAFWKTIKYLLFRPARLTKEYLDGKRMAYVPPVKLYIFISFITFLIPSFLPSTVKINDGNDKHDLRNYKEIERKPRLDEKELVWFPSMSIGGETGSYLRPIAYRSVKEMDSVEARKPYSLRLNSFERKLAVKQIHLHNHYTPYQVWEKFIAQVPYNIPKALFLYLPLFAFWLWLFHGKKRWYFFDHGIFTLHYFSFLMLSTTISMIFFSCFSATEVDALSIIAGIIFFGILIWQVYYFYRAHRKMYGESFFVNFLKSTAMFFINFISIIVVLALLLIYTYLNLH